MLFEVASLGEMEPRRLKRLKYVAWWCPSLTLLEVAISAAMGVKSGKNVVWWCPSLTLRVSISRWKPPRHHFKTDASGFYFSMETAKAPLQNGRFGFLFLDGNRQGATSKLTLRVSISRCTAHRRTFKTDASRFGWLSWLDSAASGTSHGG